MSTMKTKGGRKPKPPATETYTVGPVEQTASDPKEDVPAVETNTVKPRISIPLNEDGSFDFTSVRDATKEKLRAAIASTPGIAAEPSTAVPVDSFPPGAIYAMYGALGAAEAMVAQSVGKIPREIAIRVFTYSQQEMDLLVPPTGRLLQKYCGEWWLKWQDEIALGILLSSMTMAKVNACIMLRNASQANSTPEPKKEGNDQDVKLN